jgi:hypothetical protein
MKMRINRCGLPSYIYSSSCGKRGGAMVETVLLNTIYLLFLGLVGMSIIVIILIITLVIILDNNEKKHL